MFLVAKLTYRLLTTIGTIGLINQMCGCFTTSWFLLNGAELEPMKFEPGLSPRLSICPSLFWALIRLRIQIVLDKKVS